MCNTYTIIFKCKHKQRYTHYCSSYLSLPRQRCAKLESLGPHYYVNCRKCQGQERDSFVVFWIAGENKVHNSKFEREEQNGKGTDSDYMLGTGHFDFVPNRDQRAMEGGVRVYQDGTEEAKREKKGLGNTPLEAPTASMGGLNAEPFDDSHQPINGSTYDPKTNAPRAQSFPIKVKSKKSGVFGSLKKLIIRPKSEQDTAATGERQSPTQSNYDSQGTNRLNTIAGSFKGSKKPEELEEHGSFSVSEDGRKIDNATGYEIITLDKFCQLHFNGVVAGPGSTDPVTSNATSAPIDIPRNNRAREAGAERIARAYIEELPSSPFDGERGFLSSINSHHGRQGSTDSSAHARSDSTVSGRQSQDTHPNISDRMSVNTEFSQPDEELMEQVLSTSSGGVMNITPHNVDNVLAVLKGSLGTSSSSLSIGTPPRHHALSHPGHSNSFEALPISVPRPARLRALESQGLSVSLPDSQGFGERVAKAHWAQGNIVGRSPSTPSAPSPLQQSTNLGEPSRPRDIPTRNNTTIQAPIRGFASHKRNDTRDVLHSRHPLANEVTRSHILANSPQTQTTKRPILQVIQEPPPETIPGPRYSTIPVSPPPSSKSVGSEQGRQPSQLWKGKGTSAAKPGCRAKDRVNPTLDRSSVMTTISQFIPSRNEKLDEVTAKDSPGNISAKVPRQQIGRPNCHHLPWENDIPTVPHIPEAYTKHPMALPRIGRDASGRFSVEHIDHGPEFLCSSREDEGEAERKMPAKDAPEDVPIDPYKNHTVGTWDAILRNHPPEVSPLSSVEDLNELDSPMSPLGEEGDAWKWRDVEHGFGDPYSSPGPGDKESDLVPQHVDPSDMLPPLLPSTFSPGHRPAAPVCPPPQLPPRFSLGPQLPRGERLPPEDSTFIDPTIPVTRPLQIRKVKQGRPEASVLGAEDLRVMQRQIDYMEEEFRRADERLRGLRDGRGGMAGVG